MPFVLSESLSGMSWSSSESIHAGSTEYGSGYQTPTSGYPLMSSSTPTSPDNTLRRRKLKHARSFNNIIQEPFVIRSDVRDSRCQSPLLSNNTTDNTKIPKQFAAIFGWYPCFLLDLIRALIVSVLPETWGHLCLMLPLLWVTISLCIFKQVLRVLSIFVSRKAIQNRTVLISGGSSVQALHLARNFRSTGARVIMCEVEGLFALGRFSTAVSTFYTVPKPTSDKLQNYVRALSKIVVKEQVNYYVPVCATTSAYYDAVAKPHLELLGCCCFCPGIKEVWIFDDTLEVLKRCHKYNIPVPIYHEVTSKADVTKLYETTDLNKNRYIMSAAGPRGLRERSKIVLPGSKDELHLTENVINEHKPWVIVKNIAGEHYLTCTLVRNSQMIANVTCRMDTNTNTLVSVDNKQIDNWIIEFFNKIQLLRPVSGHFSFRFAICRNSKTVIPLSSQVGISLPYICFNNVHPNLLWRHCKHSRQNSKLLLENGHIKVEAPEVVQKSKNYVKFGRSLDKKKSLFRLTDPFPYCSYYYLHLPFKHFLNFLDSKQSTSKPHMNARLR